MAKPLQQVVCPYCGQTQSPAPRCKNCGGMFDALSVTATEIEMGPWFVHDTERPFLPGCSFEVLCKRIAARRIKPDTILRGPTTRQLWRKAKHTPCIAHLLGSCHACGASVKPKDQSCHSCGALFAESKERDELGLRFRTAYAAASGRAELKKAMAKAQADANAAAEAARQPKPKPPPPSPHEQEVKAAAAGAEGWSWATAPAQPAPGSDDDHADAHEPESAFDETHIDADEPQHTPAEQPPVRYATQAVIAVAPTDGAAATVARSKRAHPFFGENADEQTAPKRLLGFGDWTWTIILGALFAALYHLYLYWQGLTALQRFGDWSHAIVIPLISLWFIHNRRDQLIKRDARVCWQGLPILFVGIVGYAWANTPPLSNHMIQGYSMILALLGLVLFLLGPSMMRLLWLPITYLAFGVTISARLWELIAARLQQVAANIATVVLQILGTFLDIDAARNGTTIELSFARDGQWLTGQALNVAEACSGLRMLAAFMALGVLVAYMTPRAWWQRLILFLLTVPIAIAVNVGRVVILGLLMPVSRDMAQGDFHQFVGVLMLIPALLLYMLSGWILDRVYLYDEAKQVRDELAAQPAKRKTAQGDDDIPIATTTMERISRVIKGFLAGGWLCFMVGVTFVFTLISLRPAMVSDDFERSLALKLLVGDVALLLVSAWLVGKLIEPEIKKPRTMGRLVSLGLAAGILLVAVASQQVVLKSTRAVMIKEPIPIARPLARIPTRLGDWEMSHEDPPLPADVQDTLGTPVYISRVYEDTSLDAGEPGRLIKLHIAYYTGTPDTVPHVPERCFVAGGMQYVDKTAATLDVSSDLYRAKPKDEGSGYTAASRIAGSNVTIPDVLIPATVFTYANADDADQQSNVVYFFSANGKFLGSPDMVRLYGFDIRDVHSYYCKIELMLPDVTDARVAQWRATAFLRSALPEIMACLPDWDDVQ